MSRVSSVLKPSRAADALVAALALTGSLVLLAHRDGSRLDLVAGLLAACATLPLVAGRDAPQAVFAITGLASALVAASGAPFGAPIGPTLALYLLAASREDARPWTRSTTILALALFAAHAIAATVVRGSFPALLFSHVALAWLVAWFAGERTRLRREHIAELEQRADRARELAAAEERARIARDLHDSAGHAISVIAVRAGAARLRHDEDAERSRRALEEIEQLARHTADDIDAIVGALRSGDRPVHAPLGLASLGDLVERYRSAGLEVSVAEAGTRRPLDAPVDAAAYRILQEALTNAARHGLGSAGVRLAYGDNALELTVENPVSAAPANGGGHGLTGMRERAVILNGSLDSERVNGTFRLRAQLPYATRR